MSLLQQRVPSLLGGVSQLPPAQRLSSQLTEQVNALSEPTRGVMKRPPSRFLGKLVSDVTGWDTAFVHSVNRDESDRYVVVIADGDIKVFDTVTLEELTVEAPGGTSYLTDSAGKGFRAVTIGDTTVIVNRGVEAKQGTKKTAAAKKEALVYVRQSDFSTAYSVTLNDVVISLRTVDQTLPANRAQISTEAIAADLLTLLAANGTLSAAFVFTQLGSSIHMARTDGGDFTVSVSDGLADQGLVAVKNTVQTFDLLPPRAPAGFLVEIIGALETSKDNYFVQFDDLGLPGQRGVWREVPKPGTLVDLDPSTLPHRLTLKGSVSVEGLAHEPPPDPPGLITVYLPTPVLQTWDSLVLEGTPPGTALPGAAFITAYGGGCDMVAAQDGTRMFFVYDIDISRLVPFDGATVSLIVNGVTVDSRHHRPLINDGPPDPDPTGPTGPFFTLRASNVTAGDAISVRLTYDLSTEPSGVAFLTFFADCFAFYDLPGKTVTVKDAIFPTGTVLTLTLNTSTFAYTVGAADEDAASVWTGLVALVTADATWTIPSSASPSFNVVATDGTTDITTSSLLIAFPALTFHNHLLDLGPGDLIGKLVQNVTDGSSGVVTGNTGTTITVASLTGGADDAVNPGDLFSVTVDPSGGTFLVFEPIPWKERQAGDIDVVTFPSFIGHTIREVFFYQNRLGMLSEENIVMSSSGDLFNLFRYTATDLRADDVIDVSSAHAEVTIFDSAFLWADGLYVKSDNVWFRVSGQPALTPTTIRLDPVGKFPSSKDPRPVVLGSNAMFTRAKSGNTQVFELALTNAGTVTVAQDITIDIPTYIKGAPIAMVGDSAAGFVALLTDAGTQQDLYIFRFKDQNGQRHLFSWSRWEFAEGTRIVALGMADGVLQLVRKHGDGAYIEEIDLDLTPTVVAKVAFLDRRVDSESTPSGMLLAGEASSYDAMSDTTTWTLPYAVATDGSQGGVSVVNRTSSTVYTTTRPSLTTVAVTGHGDLTGALVYVGQPYEYTVTPTQVFLRGGQEAAELAGRLQLRYLDLYYNETTDLMVTVTPLGRQTRTYVVASALPVSGKLHISIQCQSKDAAVVIKDSTPGPSAVSELDWEGWYTSRGRRV